VLLELGAVSNLHSGSKSTPWTNNGTDIFPRQPLPVKLRARNLHWDTGVAGPVIMQDDDTTVGGVRPAFTTHAQDSTVAGSTGADYIMRPGHGVATHGRWVAQDAAAVDRLYIDAVSDIFAVAASYWSVYVGGALREQLAATLMWLSVPTVQFGSAVVGPSVNQDADATAAVSGDTLTVHAQDVTDAGSRTDGGDLALRGGNSAGNLASTGGDVQLQAGNATAAGVGSVGGSILLTVGTAATRGVVKVTNGAVWFDGTNGPTPTSGAGTRLMWIPAKAAFRAGLVTGVAWDNANVGLYSFATGVDALASGTGSAAIGDGNASGPYSLALGATGYATLYGQVAAGTGTFGVPGDAQRSSVSLMRHSTDAGSPGTVELTLDGTAPAAGNRLSVPSGKLMVFDIKLGCYTKAGADVGTAAAWFIHGSIKNVGGTTALVGIPHVFREGAVSVPINVDAAPTHADAFLATAHAAVTADDANDCLAVTVHGVASAGAPDQFDWHADVQLSEVA
jgi:hypothetical protein